MASNIEGEITMKISQQAFGIKIQTEQNKTKQENTTPNKKALGSVLKLLRV